MLSIQPAVSPADLALVRELLLEYQTALDLDLGFQGFEAEVRNLPGAYAPPAGRLLLAWAEGTPVGCAALRSITPARGEMKRLYVRPQARGLGAGKSLALRILAEARAAGYRELVLDTLPTMTGAQALYLALGFREIPPYRPNPVPGARFLGLDL